MSKKPDPSLRSAVRIANPPDQTRQSPQLHACFREVFPNLQPDAARAHCGRSGLLYKFCRRHLSGHRWAGVQDLAKGYLVQDNATGVGDLNAPVGRWGSAGIKRSEERRVGKECWTQWE